MKTEQYEHHGREVHVVSAVKGQHRDHCLCYTCELFKPGHTGQFGNCYIAEQVYKATVDHGIVTPVYECPHYTPVAE